MTKAEHDKVVANLLQLIDQRDESYKELYVKHSELRREAELFKRDFKDEHRLVEELELELMGARTACDYMRGEAKELDPRTSAGVEGREREKRVEDLAKALSVLMEGGR